MICGIKRTLGFCFGSLSGVGILLDPDLIQHESQAGDRCQEGTQDGCHQSVLAGQLTEAIELVGGQDRAFHTPPLMVRVFSLFFLANSQTIRAGAMGSPVVEAIAVVPFRTSEKS